MKRLIALALLCGSLQASAQTVETAEGTWGHLPLLKRVGDVNITDDAVIRIHEIVAKGGCAIPGQSRKKLDMRVPFAVHYQPDGTPARIVLQKLGCAEVEGILGGQLLALVRSGEFEPTGENDQGWYRGVISFSSSG